MYKKILTTFVEVDELDGTKDGHVTPRQFVDELSAKLKTFEINDCSH